MLVMMKLTISSLEILKIILGNVRWALDLAKYLVDDLFELAENFNKQPSETSSGTQACMCYPIFLIPIFSVAAPVSRRHRS